MSFGINNEFDDDFACIYNFLGFSSDFSPIFQIDADTVPRETPSTTSTDYFYPRCNQTPMVDSIDDEDKQMPKGVQALFRRFERLQLQQDLPH